MNEANNDLSLQVEQMERLVALAKELDETGFGALLRTSGRLSEIGLDALENRKPEPPTKYLPPREVAEALGVTTKTLSNYSKRWEWFTPAFGNGKAARYESTMIDRIVEAKQMEGVDNG